MENGTASVMASIEPVVATVLGIFIYKEEMTFESAFGMREIAMGTMGGMMLTGIKRGLFSNEAGMGSAPNAAATAEVSHPVQQGLIQTLGVFTDTIIIFLKESYLYDNHILSFFLSTQ